MGDIEIHSFDGKIRWLKGRFRDGYERLLVRKVKGRKVATVPEGSHAVVVMRNIPYEVRNYRERGGHTGGGRIDGDGLQITLDRANRTNAIDLNIFRFIPRKPK